MHHLVLIGLRGSGKSTLGRLVAQRRGCAFLDLDDAVLQHLGHVSVADAWAALGEPAFRLAETECLRNALHAGPDKRVIALGGGTPTAPGAAELLRDARQERATCIVYLRAQPDTLRARLGTEGDADRPPLTGTNTLDEIGDVFAVRDPLYRSLASHTIELDNHSGVDELVDRLCGLWPDG